MRSRGSVATIEEPLGVSISFWREVLSTVDYLKMKASPVYYGFGIPKGNGEPVIVIPGFLGCDFYLLELYLWLRRAGYRPHMSHIGQNAECPDLLIHRLMGTVNRVYDQTGQPIHLVGHSLGGVLARAIAARRPDRVASVIMLGSPFRGIRVSPWVHRSIEYVRKRIHGRRCRGKQCFTTTCACGFSCTMRYNFPPDIPQTAVYTKTDGVVDWAVCINNDPETDVEVSGTHIGLVWNAQVFRVIAERLHAAGQTAARERRAAEKAAASRPRQRKAKAVSSGKRPTKDKRPGKAAAARMGTAEKTKAAPVRRAAPSATPPAAKPGAGFVPAVSHDDSALAVAGQPPARRN